MEASSGVRRRLPKVVFTNATRASISGDFGTSSAALGSV
eukprot:CAMPEP_0180782462 /NCGR_PEP_ID=MMETSP1038_2-20121128/48370_1 /TAXON_ID=632150 /ORGANISM="Azadinium spinosum, Strain 3D9" /LENGTH=38 /DNA_ID= /DNA_START= /DNA_END= /DNA_ORIENTATION=